MVKARFFPASGVVAGRAVSSSPTTMHVISHVTGVTLRRRALKCRITMAAFTGYRPVRSGKREVSRRMIKFHFAKCAGRVAGSAVRTQLAVVHISRFMTAHTGGGSRTQFAASAMACITGDRRMTPGERITTQHVIKRLAIKAYNVSFSALMIRMTRRTTRHFLDRTAVEAPPRVDIGLDLFMTG